MIVYLCWLLADAVSTRGQYLVVFDQQSSTDESSIVGNTTIQPGQPIGQSFTPTLFGIDFVRLKLNDYNRSNGFGATLFVNLRSNSITGPILGSTASVSLDDNFEGVVNFTFSNSVSLIPSVTYFFQPVVQSGDLWNLDAEEYNYSGGMTFYQGVGSPGSDLWFREGVITVPERSTLTLLSLGALAVGAVWRRRARV